jgi:hypothetical protein
MAIRRAKQKQQVMARLAEAAPPGETFVTTVHTETGPSPWLNMLFDRVPLLGLIIALTRKFYFLTLTNTSVVVNSANRFTNRPGDIVAAFSRDTCPVSRIKRGRVWSVLYLQFPDHPKPTRLNIHFYWRAELDQLIAALPSGVQASVVDETEA